MTKIDLMTLGYPRTHEEMRAAEPLERFLTHLVRQGFRLVPDKDASFDLWRKANLHPELLVGIDPDRIQQAFRAERSPQTHEELTTFLSGQTEEFECWCLSTDLEGIMRDVHFLFALSVEEGMLYISILDIYFTQREHEAANTTRYAWWLDTLRVLYEIWHPIYIFEYLGHGENTTRDQALALEPQFLYPLSFFGPEIVEKLGGLEYVLGAPAWRVESLSDGGVMLVIEPYDGSSEYRPQAVADYLHLPYYNATEAYLARREANRRARELAENASDAETGEESQ